MASLLTEADDDAAADPAADAKVRARRVAAVMCVLDAVRDKTISDPARVAALAGVCRTRVVELIVLARSEVTEPDLIRAVTDVLDNPRPRIPRKAGAGGR